MLKKIEVVSFGRDEDGQEVTGNFLLIPAGAFYVGEGENRRLAAITRPFYMQETPVTQRQYVAITGTNPARFKGNAERPVEQVSWDNAIAFCRRLRPQSRLPTEMEWNWVVRGGDGDKYKWAGSNNPAEVAWTANNSYSQSRLVKQLKPNGYGLYDMSGAVWEWCSDWYVKTYPQQELIDYRGLKEGSTRVKCGGNWRNPADGARVGARSGGSPGGGYDDTGFRLVMDIP